MSREESEFRTGKSQSGPVSALLLFKFVTSDKSVNYTKPLFTVIKGNGSTYLIVLIGCLSEVSCESS